MLEFTCARNEDYYNCACTIYVYLSVCEYPKLCGYATQTHTQTYTDTQTAWIDFYMSVSLSLTRSPSLSLSYSCAHIHTMRVHSMSKGALMSGSANVPPMRLCHLRPESGQDGSAGVSGRQRWRIARLRTYATRALKEAVGVSGGGGQSRRLQRPLCLRGGALDDDSEDPDFEPMLNSDTTDGSVAGEAVQVCCCISICRMHAAVYHLAAPYMLLYI
jgi:hypothetical protein